ncbi:Serine/threonine protein phosphatase [Spraguea lophii 42_110]|uniref:Serine/threonine-protein phosphatase n=1 Tax=Spraguea lophii (strain 42_110) TaxID=1358809 RepID=S7W5E9_SPRLO|nr:Serine/threonine protein phosphatase [Spraguea lophii 42_110]
MEMLKEKLINGHCLTSEEIEFVCERAIEVLMTEPNVVYVSTPVNICGDIHGQYFDLLNIFKIIGTPPESKFIFLGDYVDRGENSIETITLLLLLKVMYPERIILLRGNHETREISRIYGFYDEVKKTYGSSHIWWLITEVFEFFCLGAIVDGRIFCVHGGISPNLISIHQIQRISRFKKILHKSNVTDLLWSDPYNENGFAPNKRGAGYFFGNDVLREFLELNDLTKIIRAHQLIVEGYKIHYEDKSCVTVFSAPNYMYRCGNIGSVCTVFEDLDINDNSFTNFKEVEYQKRNKNE